MLNLVRDPTEVILRCIPLRKQSGELLQPYFSASHRILKTVLTFPGSLRVPLNKGREKEDKEYEYCRHGSQSQKALRIMIYEMKT